MMRVTSTHFKQVLVGRNPRRTLLRALVLIAVLWGSSRFLVRPALTDGISMEPTVHDGSLHLIDRVTYRMRAPMAGEIVAIHTLGNRVWYLKRVLAVPGQRVAMTGGQLTVDDQPVVEPYVKLPGDWTFREMELRAGEYFVAGDNRATAIDEHLFGRVQRSDIVGRLLW